jgi:hypothetical protein
VSPEEITVFKNNGGQGIAELAIAHLILSKARENGLGLDVSWGEGYGNNPQLQEQSGYHLGSSPCG